MYKAILWDADDTLLDFGAAGKASLVSCFKTFGLGECTQELIDRYFAINKKYWERLELGEITKREVLVGRYEEFFAEAGIDTALSEQFSTEYMTKLGDTIVFCENSMEIVKSLIGKYKQYIISNGTIIAQTRKLKNSGFDNLMDGVFLSERIGFEKPSREFFNKVFEEITDISKDEMLIVGDSLTSDIRGGNNAGIKTCWYNPKRNINDKGVQADYEIHKLNEIYDILGSS